MRGAALQGRGPVVAAAADVVGHQALVPPLGTGQGPAGRRLGRRQGLLLGAGHHDGADEGDGQAEVAQGVAPGQAAEVAPRLVLVHAEQDHAGDAQQLWNEWIDGWLGGLGG